MSNDNRSYLFNVGVADQERLAILAEVYGSGSQAFLQTHALPRARTVLDIGCGHGQMTFWMAQQLQARGGKVVGIDTSDEQLNICRGKRNTNDVANVQFLHHDMGSGSPDLGPFDLAYCRFLLMHVKEWDSFFQNVLASCRSGGSFILEEPAFPFFCLPERESVKRANTLANLLSTTIGLTFDCSARLWSYVQDLDVDVVDVKFSQPTLTTPQQKSLISRSFDQIKAPLLAAKLATAREIDDIATDLEALVHDPHSLIGGLRVMQLELRKR